MPGLGGSVGLVFVGEQETGALEFSDVGHFAGMGALWLAPEFSLI